MQARSLDAVEMCSFVLRLLPLAKYANINLMCGYVFWQGEQLCLAGKMKVKVQPVQESGCTRCRHKDRVLFMRGHIYAVCTICKMNMNLTLTQVK